MGCCALEAPPERRRESCRPAQEKGAAHPQARHLRTGHGESEHVERDGAEPTQRDEDRARSLEVEAFERQLRRSLGETPEQAPWREAYALVRQLVLAVWHRSERAPEDPAARALRAAAVRLSALTCGRSTRPRRELWMQLELFSAAVEAWGTAEERRATGEILRRLHELRRQEAARRGGRSTRP